MKTLSWLVLGLLLVLSACAPTIKGSSSINALDIDEDRIVLNPGQTWYLTGKLPARAFNVEMPDPRFTGAKAGDVKRVMIDDRFVAVQSGLPEGWDFGLYSRVGVQQIADLKTRSRSTHMSWYEYVQFTFEVHVPASTSSGKYETVVALTANDEIHLVPITIMIEGQTPSGSQS